MQFTEQHGRVCRPFLFDAISFWPLLYTFVDPWLIQIILYRDFFLLLLFLSKEYFISRLKVDEFFFFSGGFRVFVCDFELMMCTIKVENTEGKGEGIGRENERPLS